MGIRSKQSRHIAWVVTALILAVGLIASGLAASAASLGGINSPSLYATSRAVNIDLPGDPVAYDTFVGCQSHLEGWIDSLGNEWTSHEGNWICVANAVARNQKRVSVAHATLDAQVNDNISVSTEIVRISQQKNKSGPGLALFDDGTNFISVLYKREQGRLVLGVMAPSGYREIVDVDPISDYDTVTLTAQIQGHYLTVLLNDSPEMEIDLTLVLTEDEQLLLLDNTRFGLASDNDNWSRFGSFTVEILP